MQITIPSLQHTGFFGRILGGLAEAGDVILLVGALGAGKTTLTQAIAAGLGVPEECYVVSPSFSLMHEYQGRVPLYHIDCYRLTGEDDVEGSGLMDYIVADGVAVVEWPDRLGTLRPSEFLEITLHPQHGESRVITIVASGRRWQERLTSIRAACREANVPLVA